MTASIHFLGDALPALALLTRSLDPSDRPRCILVAVDLAQVASTRDAKHQLQQALEAGIEGVRRSPTVRHVILVIVGEVMRGLRLERAASSRLERAHALLEQSAARDVEFTMLNVSACDDPDLLAGRIVERAESAGSSHGVVALNWVDIVGQSIAAAARQVYS